jgi:hypothetical protein
MHLARTAQIRWKVHSSGAGQARIKRQLRVVPASRVKFPADRTIQLLNWAVDSWRRTSACDRAAVALRRSSSSASPAVRPRWSFHRVRS